MELGRRLSRVGYGNWVPLDSEAEGPWRIVQKLGIYGVKDLESGTQI